jgi:transcriptional regulator GlxA family with amidase domain
VADRDARTESPREGPHGSCAADARGSSAEAVDGDPRLRRVKERLEADLAGNLPLGRAAEIAGLSRAYFSDYFRRKTGMRFTRWVHGVRVRSAMQLIETSDDSLSGIARRVGYRSLRTFERAFHRHVAQAPRQFRRAVDRTRSPTESG